ncbi:MAG: hypothetical protein CMP06_09640 [Xanthomonadales bacterium]|nr:hypothetical protein [Xanthomonadales bacterium]
MSQHVDFAAHTYTVEPDVGAVVASLRSWGVAIIRRQEPIPECEQRFDALIEALLARAPEVGAHAIQYHRHPTNLEGQVIRVRDPNLLADEAVYADLTTQSALFEAVCREYLGQPVRCPSAVFLTSDGASADVLLPWHFDRQHSLKLYILASEIGPADGGLLVSPGTHHLARALADRHVLLGGQLGTLANDVPPRLVQSQYKFTGTPGDIIIFDSDCFHMAEQVRIGQRRRVIRLHAHRLPIHKYVDAVSGAGIVSGIVLWALRPWLRRRVRQLNAESQPAFVRTRPVNRPKRGWSK